MIDWSTYKFHASSLPKFLVKSRGSDPLSETTKAHLRDVFIKEVYNRDHLIFTKYMAKGTAVESDSLDLLQQATGEVFFKNKKKLSNDFITGTPDVLDPAFILDIKSSWDIWTFAAVDEKKAHADYYGQMLGYMWMHNVQKARLIYCLVNTPEHLISKEVNTLRQMGIIGDDAQEQLKVWKQYEYNDIPAKERVKEYVFEFDDAVKETLITQIEAARKYLSGLTL